MLIVWPFFLPAAIIIAVIVFLSIWDEHSSQVFNPQYLVSDICVPQQEITEHSEVVMVRFVSSLTYSVGDYATIRLSSFKGNIDANTKVMIVLYEEDGNSYKVERYQ